MRAVALALAALAVTPAPAGAVTLVLPDGRERPQPYQRWADESKVPTVAGAVQLRLEPCPSGQRACADPWGDPPAIYLDPGAFDRVDVLHELGHVFDERELDDGERARFARLVRAEVGWDDYAHAAGDGPYPTAEKFATAYSICARWGRRATSWTIGDWGLSYDYDVPVRAHRRACRLIRGAAS